MKILTLILLLITTTSFAGKHKHHKKSLAKHQHGAVTMQINIVKNEFNLELTSPAESFYEFEHTAKSDKDKNTVEMVNKDLKENILTYLDSASLSDCKIMSSELKQEFEGKNHSEIHLNASVKCEKDLASRKLSVTLLEKYPRIEMLQIVVTKEASKADIFKVKSKKEEITL